MVLIRGLVREILTTGYLTVADEEQLQQLLAAKKYDLDDFRAFKTLEQTAIRGRIHQESRRLRKGGDV